MKCIEMYLIKNRKSPVNTGLFLCLLGFNLWRRKRDSNPRAVRQTVFKTASLWPLRYSCVCKCTVHLHLHTQEYRTARNLLRICFACPTPAVVCLQAKGALCHKAKLCYSWNKCKVQLFNLQILIWIATYSFALVWYHIFSCLSTFFWK